MVIPQPVITKSVQIVCPPIEKPVTETESEVQIQTRIQRKVEGRGNPPFMLLRAAPVLSVVTRSDEIICVTSCEVSVCYVRKTC